MLTRLPSRDELLAERCRRNLPTFIREAWPILEPATAYVHGWHVDVVCDHLEAVSRGEIRRLIINIPPRAMKSLTAAVCWPAWEWLTNPHLRWLFASYGEHLSVRDSLKCRRLIESRGGAQEGTLLERVGYQGLLKLLTDDPWNLTGDQNAKTRYDNTATGFRLATSVGGMATGEGGDRIVIDDPLNPKQARSDTERAAANTWWSETMTTRFNNADAAGVLVMQRLHQNDLTGHLLDRGGWEHLCLPAEYEPNHPFVWPDDQRTEPGELLEPVRLSEDRIRELKLELGSYAYAGQMQQRPSPDEGGMFDRSWWPRHQGPPEGGWTRTVASWDMRFASHDKQSSSYVVGQVWAINGANRYLIAQIRRHLSFTATLKAVRALQAFIPCQTILVERKANGEAVMDTLKDEIPGIVGIEPQGGKDVRAAAVSPQVEAKNVWLPASDTIPAPPGYEPTTVQDFIEEHAVFPNGSHDDQVDAMTQALTHAGQIVAPAAPVFTTKASRWKI